MASMITGFILNIIWLALLALTAPLRLLDDVTLETSGNTALSQAIATIGSFNAILPLGVIFTVLGIILVIEAGVALYKVIMWVIRRIPTQS